MARKKKTDSMIKAVPLPEEGTNMKDTWNPAELNEESKTKDTWNPAVLNEELKRFDSWNPAELNSYLTNKYNLEAVHDAEIDDNTAHFVTLEPSTIQEIDYDIDQETGTASQAILQSATFPVPGNNSPYVYRSNPTDSTGRNFCYQPVLIGGSVVWNQLVKNGNFASVTGWSNWNASYSATNNEATVTCSASQGAIYQDLTAIIGHKYLASCSAKVGTATSAKLFVQNVGSTSVEKTTTSNTFENLSLIMSPTVTSIRLQARVVGENTTAVFKNMQLIDLTQMFGTTIADYIYTLEQNTSGSGVAWFRKYFPNEYYAYSAPTIQSTKVSSKVVKDANDQTVATYNLSGSHLVKRNYEYRAYASGDESLADTITDGTHTVTKLTTPTTETVTNPTLYGIWKLDANNNLYFDGDSVEDIPNVQAIATGGTQEYIDADVAAEERDVSLPAGGQEYYLNNITVVTVPDPPETLTSASVSIDNEGIVTITDTSGEEPATYTTEIDMPDTLLGENYLTVIPGVLTGVKYTRIQPKIRRTKK